MATTKELHDGVFVTTHPAPRPGIDLLNAPRSVLKSYGLWPTLAHPATRHRWSRLLGRGTCYVEPTFTVHTHRRRRRRQQIIQEATDSPKTWSGALVYAPADQTFQSITAQWTVPSPKPSTTGGPTYSASWIGIDGDGTPDGSSDVCQAGIECDTGNTVTGDPPIYAWWEWYPDIQIRLNNDQFPVSAGDIITCLITVNTATSDNPNCCTGLFSNQTTGQATFPPFQFTLHPQYGVKLTGNCAEWIVERPLIDNVPSQLTNYGKVIFSGCSASTSGPTSQAIQPGQNNIISMKDGNATLSQASSQSSGTIICTYVDPSAVSAVT